MRGHWLRASSPTRAAFVTSALGQSKPAEPRPDFGPKRRSNLVDYEHDASPVHQHATSDSQDALADTLEAPALMRRRLHHRASRMRDVIGEGIEEQDDFVLGEAVAVERLATSPYHASARRVSFFGASIRE